jgi:hypothetical protein
MKKRLLLILVVLTGMFFLTASIVWAQPAPVAKTGQTTSYLAGDDGDLEKGIASPSPRFIDNGDETVTDNLTGLMWTQDSNLGDGFMTWNEAINYANSLSLGSEGCGTSYTDWRLPNVKELQSLIDFSNYNRALPTGHPFSNEAPTTYWSSTTYVAYGIYAWIVSLATGDVSIELKTNDSYIWAVRGGN